MDQAARERDMYDRQTVLFLDEIHRFTKAQQDALLPGVETRQVILVAATTENPSFSVIAPLLSRSMLITLDVAVRRGGGRRPRLGHPRRARAGGGVRAWPTTPRAHLVRIAGGDARRALTSLEAAAGVAHDEHTRRRRAGRPGRDHARPHRAGRGASPACATTRPATSTTTSRRR